MSEQLIDLEDADGADLGTSIKNLMERGAGYSAARRTALTATARAEIDWAGWPVAVPARYDETGGGLQHDATILRNVLRAAGVTARHSGEPFTEAMLAGLGGGLGFGYTIADNAGYHPTFTIVTTASDAIAGALRRLDVAHDIQHATSTHVAERSLDAALASGTTPICSVDRMGLPWHGCVDLISTAMPHAVAVLGGKQILWLDDECVRPTPMERQFFLAAWGWYVRGRHQLIRLAPGTAVRAELDTAARAAIAATVARLSRPQVRGIAPAGEPAGNMAGLRGMRLLVGHLADSRAQSGWSRRYAHPEALFHALRRLYECLETDPGGSGAGRPLYARFLEEVVGAGCGPSSWQEAAALFRRSGAEWSAAAADVLASHPVFVQYDEHFTRRLELQLRFGTYAAETVAALNIQMAGLASVFAANALDAGDRRRLLDHLAERVARAAALEERAVTLLADGVSARDPASPTQP